MTLERTIYERFGGLLAEFPDQEIVYDAMWMRDMEKVMAGEACCVVLRRGNEIHIKFVPRIATQWWFDCWS